MTIPIRPGPWQFLAEAGDAVGKVAQFRQMELQRRQQEAQQGVMMLAQLANLGFADRGAFADPAIAAQAARGGIPVPAGGFNPVPSIEATRARVQTQIAGDPNADPTTKSAVLGLPSPGDVAADQTKAMLARIQTELLPDLNEAQKRKLFNILPPEVAKQLETVQGAQATVGADEDAQRVADALVLGNGGDIERAKAMIPNDPQATSLQTSGVLQERHLRMAAFKHRQWWEQAQEKYLGRDRERRLAAASEQEQLSMMLRANLGMMESVRKSQEATTPEMLDQMFANSSLPDVNGKPNPVAQAARQKIADYQNLATQLATLRADNERLQGIFQAKYGAAPGQTAGTATPPPAGGTPAPAAGGLTANAAKVKKALDEGKTTLDAIKKSKLLTDAEKRSLGVTP